MQVQSLLRRRHRSDGPVEPVRFSNTERALVDFGSGPVWAHRHRNPDRSPGGWVAETAHADPESYVAERAEVFGNARVFGTSRVLDRARVLDYARVADGAIIADNAEVSDSSSVSCATIAESAVVSGHARVQNAMVRGAAQVTDNTSVNRGAVVQGEAVIRGMGFVTDGAAVTGQTVVEGPVRGPLIVLDGTVLPELDEELARPF
jgi:carbonic anhydrase/acetyltransferase-like protein (isoleucine patch superfamily)